MNTIKIILSLIIFVWSCFLMYELVIVYIKDVKEYHYKEISGFVLTIITILFMFMFMLILLLMFLTMIFVLTNIGIF